MKAKLVSVLAITTLLASTAKAGILVLVGSIGVTGASSALIGILLIVLGGPVGLVIGDQSAHTQISQQIASKYSFLDKDTREALADTVTENYVSQRDEKGNACIVIEEAQVQEILGESFSSEQIKSVVTDLSSDC